MRYAIRFMKLTRHPIIWDDYADAVELESAELAGLAPVVPRKDEWFRFKGAEDVGGLVKEVVTTVSREDGMGEHPSGLRCVVEVYILPMELL